MNKLLAVGDRAPDFTTTAVGGFDGIGTTVKLSELKGTPVVLYFYPKDDTPGCTTQACGAKIFGVSIDPVKSHEKFIRKFDLPFPLLSDPEKEIVESYLVWVEKSMYGKKYMGTERTTFVIDASGKIAAILPKVKPAEHADLVLKALKEL